MSEKKQINMNIENGNEFFAHELSINFNPMQFILDFKCITPRIDARSQNTPLLSMKHNVIMLDPWHAKQITELLSGVMKKYEEQFGKIEKPKAVKEFEKTAKAQAKKDNPSKESQTETATETMPTYFG